MRVKALSIVGFLALGIGGISAQSTTTMKGFISDENCANKPSLRDDTACVKKCVGRGSPSVLVSDDKVYKIKGKVDAARDLAGENVTITGTVDGDTITVTSVEKS